MAEVAGYTYNEFSLRIVWFVELVKTKLTVTIDDEVLPKAKSYARRRGISLSSVIEESLRRLSEPETESFTERWKGKFRPANRDDERYKRLAEKYL